MGARSKPVAVKVQLGLKLPDPLQREVTMQNTVKNTTVGLKLVIKKEAFSNRKTSQFPTQLHFSAQ